MQCPNARQLAEYHEGLGAPSEIIRLTRHIDACPRCRQEILALQRTAQMLAAMPAPRIPADLWMGVAARITAPPRRLRAHWLGKTAAGFGVAACVITAVLFGVRQQPALPSAIASASPYVTQHQLLSARDPLADRANLGVLLATREGDSPRSQSADGVRP